MIYRGKEGQWSWILHRLSGVGVLLFLMAHILDTFLIGWGPEIFNRVMAIYATPFFRISEIFLFAAVVYHALNGVRIILVDFWPAGTKFHKQMFHVTMILFFLIMIPVAYLMIQHMVNG